MRRGHRILPLALFLVCAAYLGVVVMIARVDLVASAPASTLSIAPSTSAARAPVSSTTTGAPSTTTTTVPRPRLNVPDYHRLVDWPIWRQLGRCEEGVGNEPPDGIRWQHAGPTYVGGLGMARTTYDWGARMTGLPRWRVGLPPLFQILVARAVKAHGGHWGCQVRVVGW